MRISQWPWKLHAGLIPAYAGIGVMDGLTHEWWGIPLMGAGAGLNAHLARRGYRRAHDRPKPDYAKIARLELELGLREPEPALDLEPQVRTTRMSAGLAFMESARVQHDLGGPFIRYSQPRPPAHTMDEYLAQSRPEPDRPSRCPVCTRVHVGRCAG